MSRSIKFRCWDSATGKVSEPFDVKESWGDYLIDFEDYSTDGALDSIIWEQFTGLLDRNGIEIYEGDILQIDDHIVGDFEVVWHKLGWKIKRAIGYESLSVHKSEDCTVIGNIHENGDLLK